ncbi:YCII-related domain protein [compost metagenome]
MDMNNEEKAIMQQHVAYWMDLMNQGKVIVFGPVFDPNGAFGVGIVEASSEEEVKTLIDNDPASKINHYEVYPMKAVLPAK